MKGYKVFNGDWTCRGFQYKVGEVYEMEESPKCCKVGFHFCKKLKDCFNYYKFNPINKVAIVEALGEIDENCVDSKVCTNKIKIVEELTWHDILDLVNVGNFNTGQGNVGENNSGNYNVGCWNKGDWNTGGNNVGYNNTGHFNAGSYNTGDCNVGHCNTRDNNTGHKNTGDFNTGDNNSGDYNAGFRNIGDYNLGDYNSGDYNIGSFNTGDFNIGDYNTGDFNLSNYNAGCFNTKEQKMYMFNKETNITYEKWGLSKARSILESMPTDKVVWVKGFDMTAEEQEDNPTYKITGGYLKKVKATKEEKQKWYDNLEENDKKEIKNIPNFNASIFKEVTEIDVTEIKEENK